MSIILYGTKKCQDTRKAERFLKERKKDFQFRDVSDKPLSEGELKNLSAGRPSSDLIDTASRAYEKRGLAYMDFDAFDELLSDSSLLKTPIVRIDRAIFIRPEMEKLPL
jgi:arsenate reductase-like glutaredoxin family protein